MYVYLYVFNKYNFCKKICLVPFLHIFEIRINSGSQKMFNFEKWLGLSRSLATPGIDYEVPHCGTPPQPILIPIGAKFPPVYKYS